MRSRELSFIKEELRGRLLFPDFLTFRCIHPAQALLNSTPQLLARERRAVAQGTELGPGDLRMDAAAEAAVGAGDDANKQGISPAGIYPVTTKGGTRSRSELADCVSRRRFCRLEKLET